MSDGPRFCVIDFIRLCGNERKFGSTCNAGLLLYPFGHNNKYAPVVSKVDVTPMCKCPTQIHNRRSLDHVDSDRQSRGVLANEARALRSGLPMALVSQNATGCHLRNTDKDHCGGSI